MEIIVGVERLYEYGVSIGILPGVRDMSLSLNRIKHRFMSLLLPVPADIDNSSTEKSSEEDSDNS